MSCGIMVGTLGIDCGMDMSNLGWQALAEMPEAPRSPPDSSRVVEILAFPAVQLLDVAGPLQVFATANDLAAGQGRPRLYIAKVVTAGDSRPAASARPGLLAAPPSPPDSSLGTLIAPRAGGCPRPRGAPALVELGPG